MQAIILCGGKGERLRPLTSTTPKPLVHINGKPILEYLINNLKMYGVNEVILTAGYMSEEIREFAKTYSATTDLEITVIDSGDVDIIKRLTSCRNKLSGDTIVLYGDTIADINIDSLVQLKKSTPKNDIMSAIQLKSSFGLFEIQDDGLAHNFVEKPNLQYWINIGFFVFSAETFDAMCEFDDFAEFLEAWTKNLHFVVHQHSGVHITINTLTELEYAKKEISKLGW